MSRKFSRHIRRQQIRHFVLPLVVCAWTAFSQTDMDEMSASGLLGEAGTRLASEQYGAAVPYLKEYLERMESVEDDRVQVLTQKVRLKLGKLMAWLEDPKSAVGYLEAYTEHLPRYRPREAYKLLAVNLYAIDQYASAVSAATNALARPLPVGLKAKKQKTVDYDQMTEKERGGFSARQLRRIEQGVGSEESDLSTGLSAEVPDPEGDFPTQDLVLLNMTLAESYAKLGQWPASIEPYTYVVEHAEEEDRRGFAVMQLVNALVVLERFDEAADLIVELSGTDSRYDIRVNMAMMTAAKALFGAQEVDSALMLYRMVLPRQELVDFQVDRMNQLRRDAGLPEVTVTIATNETGRVETLFGRKYGEVSVETDSKPGAAAQAKPPELIKLEEAVGVLAGLSPYENELLYRIGLLYANVGRSWEAVTALDLLFDQDPDSEMGQRAFAEALMVRVDPLKKYEEVERRGFRYLESHIAGIGPRMVAHALTISYQKQEDWKAVKKLLPVIERFVYSDEAAVRQYECELFYMQAVADMVLLNYRDAKVGFDKILTEYPGSHQQENAMYWHAMAQLFLKNHQDALSELDAYAEKWPDGSWLPSVVFHSGLCFFGLEQLEDAQERFSRVINTWPDAQVYSDACSLRGDLLAADGKLADAQADYEEAIASARTVRQATYAVFQMTSMFELEDRYEEILETVAAYLARYEDEADVAKAAYWTGKTKLAQGLTQEAVEAYRDTIIQYGIDVQQDGVDLIISELLALYRRLTNEQRDALQISLRDALQQTDSETLSLRLRVMLANMEGTTDVLGAQLLTELNDLTQAPPPVLAVLCDASFARQDYSRAADILQLFQNRYEDSDFMKPALKLRAFGLFDEERYDDAVKIADEAQALYGTDIEVVWAQLLKGRALLAKADFDGARNLLRTTLGVSQWRGEAFAEATYVLGQVEEQAGNLRDAFAWYQRAYFQYKGYAGGFWAAEGYLASARCLKGLGREKDRLNTYRAMLFDKYINSLPQADVARNELGAQMVQEINEMIAQGVHTNVTVKLSAEVGQ